MLRSVGHRELAADNDRDHPCRSQAHLNERDERGRGEQLVRDRIDHLAERRHLLAAARQVAVEPVGERGEAKNRRADQLLADAEDEAPFEFVSRTTTSSGTRKMRVAVRAFGRLMVERTAAVNCNAVSSRFDMKALLLVGGQGTRLRPLTIHAPKSIVPIFDRPFLHYQLDLIKQVPEIDEVILSLNYQPTRIEEVFGDGRDVGIKLRYVVEPTPLGTAGGVRYAAQGVRTPSWSSTATC